MLMSKLLYSSCHNYPAPVFVGRTDLRVAANRVSHFFSKGVSSTQAAP